MMTSTNIYILRLEGGKFYVGSSKNPMKRYDEHVRGEGGAWTRCHRPLGVERIVSQANPLDVDRYIKEYMAEHGVDAVRGGSYSQEELSKEQRESLEQGLGQSSRQRRIVHTMSDSEDVWTCDKCDKEFSDEGVCRVHEDHCRGTYMVISSVDPLRDQCYCCGKDDHVARDCTGRM
jgi:predicted GIY-YIG superfamily endonuclease